MPVMLVLFVTEVDYSGNSSVGLNAIMGEKYVHTETRSYDAPCICL
jgi:hypothetical protein